MWKFEGFQQQEKVFCFLYDKVFSLDTVLMICRLLEMLISLNSEHEEQEGTFLVMEEPHQPATLKQTTEHN